MEQESSLQEIRRNLIESIERLFERIENLEREVARLAENNDTVSAESESLYGSDSLPEVQPDGLPGPADEDVLPEPEAEEREMPLYDEEPETAAASETEDSLPGPADEDVLPEPEAEEREMPLYDNEPETAAASETEDSLPGPADEDVLPEPEAEEKKMPFYDEEPETAAASETEDSLPGPADEDVLPEPDAEAATEPEEGKEAENAGGEEEYKAEADWYDWEVDYPASHIDNIYDGIGINDRYEFVRELFNPNGNLHEAELLFKRTVDDLNRLSSFKEVLVYTRARFPQWDEYSDEVYRFYMIVRRKFN